MVADTRFIFHELSGAGAGTPMMLMHGGMGLDHSYFRPWLDPLGHDRVLLYYDHQGNGRSRPISKSPRGGGMSALVDDAEALRTRLHLDSVIVLAHSVGACVAMEYALKYPDAVTGLVLVSPVASAEFAAALMATLTSRGEHRAVSVLRRAFAGAILTDDEFRAGWNTLMPLYFHRYDPAIGNAIDSRMQYSAEGFNEFATNALPSFAPRLRDIRTPTLIITGDSDSIVAPEHGSARLHEEIPEAELITLADSGHFPFVEQNADFLAAVSTWVARIRR